VTAIADQHSCRLYLTTPPELVSGGVLLRDFLAAFERAAGALDVACLLIAAPEGAGDAAVADLARPLIAAAQSRDIAALLGGRPALAKALGADGVHLDGAGMSSDALLRLYREARKTLPEDAILGALCPPERHAAMELAEAGADYVGFAGPAATELIAWWGEMMTTPCIAFGRFDAGTARELAKAGADFLAPDPAAWTTPDLLPALAAAIRAG
jgi:thiamine-phosphate pyrophosphorylase